MQTYSKHRPTQFDQHLTIRADDGESREGWLILSTTRSRDSGCLEESNFATMLDQIGGEGVNVEVHRFGHWACGRYEVILVRPGTAEEGLAADLEKSLEDYPVLDEDDFSERELDAANETWRVCYSPAERIAYIRRYRGQFEFRSFADMLGCVRGTYFAGYASELLAR